MNPPVFRRPGRPQEAVIELTNRCGQGCKHCLNNVEVGGQAGSGARELTLSQLRTMLSNFSNFGIRTIRLTGGEPLLRADLTAIAGAAKALGFRVILNTSAIGATRARVAALEPCVDEVLISLNSGFETPNPGWVPDRAQLRNRERGLRLFSESRIPSIRLGTVATNDCISALDDIFEVVQSVRPSSWQFFRPVVGDRSAFPPDLRPLLKRLDVFQKATKTPIRMGHGFPFCAFSPRQFRMLPRGISNDFCRFVVDPGGFAKPHYTCAKNLGDPNEVAKVWSHSFFKKLGNHDFLPAACRGCLLRDACGGGSRYLAHHLTGRWNAPDPWMVKPITRWPRPKSRRRSPKTRPTED